MVIPYNILRYNEQFSIILEHVFTYEDCILSYSIKFRNSFCANSVISLDIEFDEQKSFATVKIFGGI